MYERANRIIAPPHYKRSLFTLMCSETPWAANMLSTWTVSLCGNQCGSFKRNDDLSFHFIFQNTWFEGAHVPWIIFPCVKWMGVLLSFAHSNPVISVTNQSIEIIESKFTPPKKEHIIRLKLKFILWRNRLRLERNSVIDSDEIRMIRSLRRSLLMYGISIPILNEVSCRENVGVEMELSFEDNSFHLEKKFQL